jgi:predicted nucleic acid-binding protein
LELLQGAQNKQQQRLGQNFLRDLNFRVLPLTEQIGHRALIYIEQPSSGLRAGDAIVPATAAEKGLCSPVLTAGISPESKLGARSFQAVSFRWLAI